MPTAKPAAHLADVPSDWLDIRVFPGESGAFRLYEDNGISPAYLHGEFERTSISYVETGTAEGVVRIDPVEGSCPALPSIRGYSVTFMGRDIPTRVLDDQGRDLPWSCDQVSGWVQIALAACPKHAATTVTIQWPVASAEVNDEGESNGLPFAHVITYTASDEATRQLAHVILVPPSDRKRQLPTSSADILWRDMYHASVTEQRQVVGLFETETILTSPISLDPSLQPHHWEIETRLAVGDKNVTTVSPGPYINPPIQRWNLRYAGQVHWNVQHADLAARPNIVDPFEVQLDPRLALEAEGVARIQLAQSMSVWFDSWTSGTLALKIDGKWLRAGQPQPTLVGLAHPWPVVRFGPVTLSAGTHSIHVRLAAPDGPQWVFGVLLVDDDGAPLYRCTYSVEGPVLEPEIPPSFGGDSNL